MAFKKPAGETHTYKYTKAAAQLPGAVVKEGQLIRRLIDDKYTKMLVAKGYIKRVD